MKSFRIFLFVLIVHLSFFYSCNTRAASQINPEFIASPEELTWLKNNAIKIKTVDVGNGFDDLQPFKNIVGNARIVGLGENTHGTSEVFRMKHRLVEFLVEEMGFNVFAIEANLPEAYKINDYVLKGEGDPKTLLKGLGSWPWNTQEVLDMILWMREYNASGKGKIQFTGFDMSTISGAFDNLMEFSKNEDNSFMPALDSITSLLQSGNLQTFSGSQIREIAANVKQKVRSIENHLDSKKSKIISDIGEPGYNLLLRDAEIMVQSSDTANISDLQTRDKYMAQNVDWILENNPGSKIILWAHSMHLRKLETYMGGILAEKYGADYVNIGFLSNSGTYTASDSTGHVSSANKLETGKPGSFEYSFHKTGIPCFCIDFKRVNKASPGSVWLTYELKCGGAGSYVQPIQYYPQNISKYFNAVIFIDSTHGSHCFDVRY